MNAPLNIIVDSQAVSFDTIKSKYAKGEEKKLPKLQETKLAIHTRVASALAANEHVGVRSEKIQAFLEAMESGAIPAGRIASAAGAGIDATLINCFVQPISDTAIGKVNGIVGIYEALAEAVETMRRGGGEGFDFSPIRPRGALVKGTGSCASGPVSYMAVFDSSCTTVVSAGARRGAMMSVLSVDHPDILEFVNAKKQAGALTQFNISVAVTNAFLTAAFKDEAFELVHVAEPGEELKSAGAYQRKDGLWVYRTISAKDLWDTIIRNTYDGAEPGILLIDRINAENPLFYVEDIRATNPCGEQPLPPYGACCLGSQNLTRFVVAPFTPEARFDFASFGKNVRVLTRMLDNVLDITYYPLEKQKQEAMSKRRIGQGFLGLGNALTMLGLKYNSPEGREMARQIAMTLRDEAYRESIELAKEKGCFPLFDMRYCEGKFFKRLPADIQDGIREHGLRNSHLVSIAPTGTISLAFADNASNGIEPAFSWFYDRKVRQSDGSTKLYRVEDHAYRVFRELGGDVNKLPESFVSALEMSATDHLAMLTTVQPYVDSAISKTVNVPEDYPFEDFKDLYTLAWRSGLKGLATYRPNPITGAVLTLSDDKTKPQDLDESDPDRKLRLTTSPKPALESLRWPSRPQTPDGNPAMTYMVSHPVTPFAVMVGHYVNGSPIPQPFEVWVNGLQAPRGLGALAKTLSTDMRCLDRQWLLNKLDSLIKTSGDPIEFAMPPNGNQVQVSSSTAALATLIKYRCEKLGIFDETADSPMLNALISLKEPRSNTEGTMSWTVDVRNPGTGDDFTLFVKELVMPDGCVRPYSVWLSGNYPRAAFDGLCKSLSLDMRIVDPAWIGKKLRSLTSWSEAQGDFMAREPGSDKSQNQPSTIAYVAKLIMNRYRMLGILDAQGFPIKDAGYFNLVGPQEAIKPSSVLTPMAGKRCDACGNHTVIKRDGCAFCTSCSTWGSCG